AQPPAHSRATTGRVGTDHENLPDPASRRGHDRDPRRAGAWHRLVHQGDRSGLEGRHWPQRLGDEVEQDDAAAHPVPGRSHPRGRPAARARQRQLSPPTSPAMVKLNKIYTRTGDDGTTGLVDGSRLYKCDQRLAAIGDVDELNSAIGVAITLVEGEYPARLLETIQNDLFDLGADFATPGIEFTPDEMTLRITAPQVTRLETAIDAANDQLGPLTSFILPGGTPAAAALHLARAVARRAERSAVAAAREVPLNPQALKYLNRLSDLLFVLAREMNLSAGGDVLWKPGATR